MKSLVKIVNNKYDDAYNSHDLFNDSWLVEEENEEYSCKEWRGNNFSLSEDF